MTRDTDNFNIDLSWDQQTQDASVVSLMVVHRDHIQVVPLAVDRPMTLGRAAPADVLINSRRLSRVHCEFQVIEDQVQVRDLDSTNGTLLNGVRISEGILGPTDEVTLGSVVVSLQPVAAAAKGLEGVQRHTEFTSSVDEELVRARTFGRGLTVMMVRPASRRGLVARWAPLVHRHLRPVDRMGLFTEDCLEVLLPETSVEKAEQLGQALVSDDGSELLVGLATYPQHGGSADGLISAAQEALDAASLGVPVVTFVADPTGVSGDESEAIVVRNSRMVAVWRTVARIASSNISVLILGETGVGKEVVARSIHESSPRGEGPMRSINCGAIPQSLAESVLFGHERGAFTGAESVRPGAFESADQGTLFLDEVGELSMSAQVALLRVLETHTVVRVGSNQELPVDVRVIAATHRDLESQCREGKFRWDLYYRLNTMTLSIPPLRERRDEIRPLARRFVRAANEMNGREVAGVTPEAMAIMERHDWPGNVRELRNVVERAVVIAGGELITVQDLPDGMVFQDHERAVQGSRIEDVTDSIPHPLELSEVPEAPDVPEVPNLKDTVRRMERELLCEALVSTQGNQTRAAELLSMSRRTLVYKMRQYAIGVTYRSFKPLQPVFDSGGRRLGFKERLRRVEETLVLRAMEASGQDLGRAAGLLGVQRRTLESKLLAIRLGEQ